MVLLKYIQPYTTENKKNEKEEESESEIGKCLWTQEKTGNLGPVTKLTMNNISIVKLAPTK